MPPGTDNLWPECAGPLKVRHGHASGLQRRRQVCTLHWAVLSDEFGNRLWVVLTWPLSRQYIQVSCPGLCTFLCSAQALCSSMVQHS